MDTLIRFILCIGLLFQPLTLAAVLPCVQPPRSPLADSGASASTMSCCREMSDCPMRRTDAKTGSKMAGTVCSCGVVRPSQQIPDSRNDQTNLSRLFAHPPILLYTTTSLLATHLPSVRQTGDATLALHTGGASSIQSLLCIWLT